MHPIFSCVLSQEEAKLIILYAPFLFIHKTTMKYKAKTVEEFFRNHKLDTVAKLNAAFCSVASLTSVDTLTH